MLRTSTERPEAVDTGYAKVMGFEAICAEIEARAGKGRPSQEHPYGTGDAARKIVDVLEGFLER
jgi:UDP-N-acetylglucosamine 2-epimerase